jgi:putative transposase
MRYCITPIAAGNTPASHASGSWPIMAVCSTSRSANVWKQRRDGELFSSLKIERTARKLYRTRDEAKADLVDYLERFYNPKRRHSRIGYMSPMEFERPAGLA